jgi:hypothetical protein
MISVYGSYHPSGESEAEGKDSVELIDELELRGLFALGARLNNLDSFWTMLDGATALSVPELKRMRAVGREREEDLRQAALNSGN